jgi:hypothetical protein
MNEPQVPADAVADAPEVVGQLFTAARSGAAADELVGLDAMLASFGIGAAGAGAAVVSIEHVRARRWVRVAAVATVVALAGGGVAAAAGSLPAPLQRAVSNVVERVGIDIPTPEDSTSGDSNGTDTPQGRPDGTTPSGVQPPGLGGTPPGLESTLPGGDPSVTTPSGVAPDDHQLKGWCTAWFRGSGNGASLDASSRASLQQAADQRGVDVPTLCAALGVTPPSTATSVVPPGQNKPENPTPEQPGGPPANPGNPGNGKGGAGNGQGASSSVPGGNGNQGGNGNGNGIGNGNGNGQGGAGSGQGASSSLPNGNGNQGNPQGNGNGQGNGKGKP